MCATCERLAREIIRSRLCGVESEELNTLLDSIVSPYEQGFEAATQNFPETRSPYRRHGENPDKIKLEKWLKGYNDAKRHQQDSVQTAAFPAQE
jgi:hypothetical protein